MTSQIGKVEVGDRLFMATLSSRNRLPKREPRLEWVVVSKVGRQYGEFHPEGLAPDKWNVRRFDLKTGCAADLTGEGAEVRLYRSEEEFHEHNRARAAWSRFRGLVANRYDVPPGISADDIQAAAELIKLEVKL